MEKKSVNYHLVIPGGGFKKCMFFTHYRIRNVGNHRMVDVVFADGGMVIDSARFFLEATSLKRCRASILGLLQKVGESPSTDSYEWSHMLPPSPPELVDLISSAFGEYNEVVLTRVSLTSISHSDSSKDSKDRTPLQVDPIAMLRGDRDVVIRFLTNLFQNA